MTMEGHYKKYLMNVLLKKLRKQYLNILEELYLKRDIHLHKI